MAFTEADLTTIRAARLRGIRTVQFSDRTVTYSTDADMRQLEEDIQRELNAAATPRPTRQFFGVASKGF